MHTWAERVSRDWPAFRTESRAGWRLGLADGFTKRANCAVVEDPGADVAEVTRFYRAHGLRPCVQVWPGEEAVDTRLAEHGYELVEPTLVLARELHERPDAPGRTLVSDAPTPRWTELFAETGVSPDWADGVLRILDQVTTAYGVHEDGEGRGCAVLDGESVAVCAMVTARAARGRGVAGSILADLLAWAHDKGARRAYLCVVAGNEPALRLYRSAGFEEVSRYHNRVLAD
ncbi:GNAT family N-acetyltransferase [Nocardiopsis sp. L17-MgMaSL7]|uniref:GNAT family N-acetyltransferase n=1 Tax=Nocardiopsis sp. L17-MgMaSL7 TaxID=1938893 RepID=UPI000D9C63C3|nr:GNAT family N-acetyltransferase [Nocardiopsis sp. L17-MgMaSL7]PWV57466.1 acetyltransferase (GNAT) family protein [Nocardiopsis sp. L17-MgMaSL7]